MAMTSSMWVHVLGAAHLGKQTRPCYLKPDVFVLQDFAQLDAMQAEFLAVKVLS